MRITFGLLTLLLFMVPLSAQTVDLSGLGTGTKSLAGLWKFHPGDDPQWANPNFDDSHWQSVQVPLSLNQQGYPDFSGYGWYRLTLQRPAQDSPADLSLAVMAITNVAEFYANGVSFGRFGAFPPHPRVYEPRPISFGIPSERWRGNRLVLAIRIWVDKRFGYWKQSGLSDASDTGSPAPTIGTPTVVDYLIAAHQRIRELRQLAGELVKFAELLLGLYLLGLYWTESRRPEYLWLGINFAGDAIFFTNTWISESTFLFTASTNLLLNCLLNPVMFTTSFLGIWATCEERIGLVPKILMVSLFLDALVRILMFEGGWLPAHLVSYDLIGLPLYPLTISVHLVFLLRQAWIKTGEIRWFALSYIPFFAVFLAEFVPPMVRYFSYDLIRFLYATTLGFSVVGVGFVLIRRSGRLRSERDRLHSEMLAAQQIQRLMLPATSLQVPYWHIETAYLPMQEVGGDFFQLSSHREGELLLLVGDVSGKGLQAALTVSLLVGFWQKLAPETDSPGEILRQLNQLIQTHVQNGFVTCLCARFESDGRVLVANAGHLAPYLNGQELVLSNGLPLGFGPAAAYDETLQILGPDDTLLFLTDGVVEARDKTRTLYGFERVQQALAEHLSADALARRAQEFGQDDDITVISICRQPVRTETYASGVISGTAPNCESLTRYRR